MTRLLLPLVLVEVVRVPRMRLRAAWVAEVAMCAAFTNGEEVPLLLSIPSVTVN